MKQELTLNNSSHYLRLERLIYGRCLVLKLKNLLLVEMSSTLLIMAGSIPLLFFIRYWQLYFSIGILMILCGLMLFKGWKLYQTAPSSILPSNTLKEELVRNYKSFQKWVSLQLKVFWFIGPIAGAVGFILEYVIKSGRPVEAVLYNFRTLGFLAIAELIAMPICYYAIKWAYNQTYGKHLKKVKLLIDELPN